MLAHELLSEILKQALKDSYGIDANDKDIVLQKTRKEFEGDFTLVTFPFIKAAKQSPEQVGDTLGKFLLANNPTITKFNVVKGFLNISLSNSFWVEFFASAQVKNYGYKNEGSSGRTVMVEYASPNTNKPLHLGHIRNIILGYSVAEILKTQGHKILKVSIVNDRGIHICKSMLAWQKFGNGETPQSSGMKGDHLVGKYYVEFDKAYKKELNGIIELAKKWYADNLVSKSHLPSIKEQKDQIIQEQAVSKKGGAIVNSIIVGFGAALLVSALTKGKKNKNSDSDWGISGLLGLAAGLITHKYQTDGINEELKKALEQNKVEFENEVAEFKTKIISEFNQYKIESFEDKQTLEKIIEFLKKFSPLISETQVMLQKWEANDKEIKDLWKTMNGWVYDGFAATYKTLGVDFDKTYYESNTYILGKEIIQEGLAKNIFYKKENGSIAIDLSADGLDEKVVLRSDGTSVYITQDIGTAIERFKEFPQLNQLIYTVGNEQDYHFKVLFLILQKLGYAWAKECYHLSYGMVELPEGKMKSREGTVVDADDLLDEMFTTAEQTTKELGKVEGFNDEELKHLYKTIGSGALKYFMLKVDAKKKMLFDPKESIDFNGNTGPFIQYTYARIQSVLQKSGSHPALVSGSFKPADSLELNELERELIKLIYEFPAVLEESAKTYNPSHIANYIYDLTKVFSRFYHDCSILKEENETIKQLRLALANQCGQIIKNGMGLLGIEVPNRM